MKNNKYFYHKILPSIARFAIGSVSITNHITPIGKERVDDLKRDGQKLIYAFWHGRQFLLVDYMSYKNIHIMTSTSRDGILQANILKKFGYGIVYGSSSKSPARALIKSIEKMRAGYDFAFAIDGPRGPIHEVKPGAIYLAKKINTCIIPITFSSYPSIHLNSWDRYLLPLPFARSVVIFGEPFYPSPSLDEKTIDSEKAILKKILNKITILADKKVGKYPLER